MNESFVYQSNVFTKKVASKFDPRQKLPEKPYTVPDLETRKLLAKLVLEEALETVTALGFNGRIAHIELGPHDGELNLEDIIDGACDTIYVATGVLVACGAPDIPHLKEVCDANDRKFPNGEAVINSETGKYLKPPGWRGPDHSKVQIWQHEGFEVLGVDEFNKLKPRLLKLDPVKVEKGIISPPPITTTVLSSDVVMAHEVADSNKPPTPAPNEYYSGKKIWTAPNGDIYRYHAGRSQWILVAGN